MCALKKNTPKKQERGAAHFQPYWLQPFFPLPMINWCVCLSFLAPFTRTLNLSATGNASLKSCCFPVRHLKSCQSTDGQTKHSSELGKKKSKQQKNQKKPNTLYIEIQSKYRVNIKNTSKSYPEIWWSSTETVEIQPVFLSSLGQKERFPHLPRKQNFKYSEFKKRIILFLLKFLKSLIQGCLPLEAPQIKSLLS